MKSPTALTEKNKPLKMLKRQEIDLFKGEYFVEWKIFYTSACYSNKGTSLKNCRALGLLLQKLQYIGKYHQNG